MGNLIFDLDGVVITYKRNFAETYSAEFGVEIGKIYEFFANDYRDCAIGRASLRESIAKYAHQWEWPGQVDELITYWFDCQSTIDCRLLDSIESARSVGMRCYAASDQEVMRANYVKTLFDVDRVFADSFFSYKLGATKAEAAFFEHVLDSLRCQPGEVFFWDDNPANVTVAKNVGLNAELYTTYEDFQGNFAARFGLTN